QPFDVFPQARKFLSSNPRFSKCSHNQNNEHNAQNDRGDELGIVRRPIAQGNVLVSHSPRTVSQLARRRRFPPFTELMRPSQLDDNLSRNDEAALSSYRRFPPAVRR